MASGIVSIYKESNNTAVNINSTQDWIQPTNINTKTAKKCNTYHRYNLDRSTRHQTQSL